MPQISDLFREVSLSGSELLKDQLVAVRDSTDYPQETRDRASALLAKLAREDIPFDPFDHRFQEVLAEFHAIEEEVWKGAVSRLGPIFK